MRSTALTAVLTASIVVALGVLVFGLPGDAPRSSSQSSSLPRIAPAPGFKLTSQDGAPVALADYRGKVVAVTFILTLCTSTCPVLTPMMSTVQDRLGRDFGTKISCISITVDPERDTPENLMMYAQAHGANLAGWTFLTGSPDVIRDVTHRYGVYAAKTETGDVDHTFLTSIIDPKGMLRVQYLGVRFDPEEFSRDLLSLVAER
jgi:protein SCO1/2